MRQAKLVSHAADAKLLLTADSLEQLFLAGLEGMANIIKDGFCLKTDERDLTVKKEIKISSPDTTAMLVDFLSETLAYSHEDGTIFCWAKFKLFSRDSLEAEVYGRQVDSFDREIKAVTYHQANVSKSQDNYWETFLVFDI